MTGADPSAFAEVAARAEVFEVSSGKAEKLAAEAVSRRMIRP